MKIDELKKLKSCALTRIKTHTDRVEELNKELAEIEKLIEAEKPKKEKKESE